MNVADARIVLRPRTLGELLDLALRWLPAVGGRLYVVLAVPALLPSLALCAAARWGLGWDWTFVWLLALAVTTVTQGLYTVAASQLMFQARVRAPEVLRRYGQRLPSYLATLVLSRIVLLAGGALVLTLPWFWGVVSLVHEASLLEGSGPLGAMKRSRRVATAITGRSFGLIVGIVGATAAHVVVFEALGYGLLDLVLQVGRPFGALLSDGGSLSALVGFHAAIPYVASARFLQYIDSRTRLDGWDIQVQFMGLAAADRASVEGPR